jgi:hypothetical protein
MIRITNMDDYLSDSKIEYGLMNITGEDNGWCVTCVHPDVGLGLVTAPDTIHNAILYLVKITKPDSEIEIGVNDGD